MEITPEVEWFVANGFVLDDEDRWVPISHFLKQQAEQIEMLNNGKVRQEGRWVSIADALALDHRERAEPNAEAQHQDVPPPAQS